MTHYEPRRVLATLADHHVDSLVIGGVAAAIHGSIRTTEDVDILCRDESTNRERLAAALNALHAHIRGSTQADPAVSSGLLRGMSLIAFETDAGDVDVFFKVPGLTTYDDFASRAFSVDIDSRSVRTVSRPDLILLKRATGRPEDIGVAEELEELGRLEPPAGPS